VRRIVTQGNIHGQYAAEEARIARRWMLYRAELHGDALRFIPVCVVATNQVVAAEE